MMAYDEKDIRKAELRRLIRNLGMKYSSARHKAHGKNDPFALYHFAQALAYEESIEIIKKFFAEAEDMKDEDWV